MTMAFVLFLTNILGQDDDGPLTKKPRIANRVFFSFFCSCLAGTGQAWMGGRFCFFPLYTPEGILAAAGFLMI
jgi:hypothetical protein